MALTAPEVTRVRVPDAFFIKSVVTCIHDGCPPDPKDHLLLGYENGKEAGPVSKRCARVWISARPQRRRIEKAACIRKGCHEGFFTAFEPRYRALRNGQQSGWVHRGCEEVWRVQPDGRERTIELVNGGDD